MKRFTALTLALFVLFALCSCKKSPAPVATNPTEATTPTEATEPSATTPSVPQQPMVAVSVPVVTEREKAGDGKEIFYYSYQNMSLTLPEPEVAEKVILDFLNKADLQATAEGIRKSAITAHEQSGGLDYPYFCSSLYTPSRVDRGVLSLSGTCVIFEGGAHGSTVATSVSYDLLTGNALTWKDILQSGVTGEQISALVLEALDAYEEKEYLFIDYADTVKSIFSQGLQHHTSWYFTDSALCCYFSPYEIGPFSLGTVAARIPYEKLVGILKDEYFPPERDLVDGTVMAEAFDPEKLSAFTQMAEIVLDGGGRKLLVSADTMVYDVRVETGSMTKNGESFIPEYTVLGAATLTPGDAIMIDLPGIDSENAIRITYTSGGETQTLIPTLS